MLGAHPTFCHVVEELEPDASREGARTPEVPDVRQSVCGSYVFGFIVVSNQRLL